ncbi:hypothetical protein ACROYT_G016128 [Oculina patagonica]
MPMCQTGRGFCEAFTLELETNIFVLARCYADDYKREQGKLNFEEIGLKRSTTGKSGEKENPENEQASKLKTEERADNTGKEIAENKGTDTKRAVYW